MRLTARSQALLETVTLKTRMVTLGQVAETWFSRTKSPRRNAMCELKKLEKLGLLTLRKATLHPPIAATKPVFTWSGCDSSEPNFGRIAWQLSKRWDKQLRSETIVQGTEQANSLTGGYAGGRPLRETELNHDMHLATVYLMHRARYPEIATKYWVHESQLYHEGFGTGEKLPDSVIRVDDVIEKVVECGGAYKCERLQAFHTAFKHVNYEIW